MYEADFQLELDGIEAESTSWLALGEGAYLHVEDEKATEVMVVGLVSPLMLTSIVLWVC
jgi:hypothetical protein